MIGLGRHRGRGTVAELGVAGAGIAGLHGTETSVARCRALSDKPAKLLAALLLAAILPVAAQTADPLKSADCGAAIAQLESARAGRAGNVEALRGAAASACLGSSQLPSRPARVLQAPISVPPPQIELPQRVAPAPAPSLPPPPVAIGRPPTPATCDAGGCWTSDGTQLRHVPPNLVGPAGLCSQAGGMVYCP